MIRRRKYCKYVINITSIGDRFEIIGTILKKYWGSFSVMYCMEVCPYSYFWLCGYFQGRWVSFVTTDEFSVRVTKITSRIGVS